MTSRSLTGRRCRPSASAAGKPWAAGLPRKSFLSLKGSKENAAGKKPAWVRTHNLENCEKFRIASAYLGIVYNDARTRGGETTHGTRHDMKCRYPAPWREAAIKTVRPLVTRIYRQAFIKAITHFRRKLMPDEVTNEPEAETTVAPAAPARTRPRPKSRPSRRNHR